jgi:MraZ protein
LESVTQFAPLVEHPRGTYTARVDDKGRLKLPAAFARYLTELGAVKVFVTSFDKRIGKIYPIPVWKEIEKKLEAGNGNGRMGKALLFVAYHLGADAEVDSQGRMLIPEELRRELNVVNEPVWLSVSHGAIVFRNRAAYEDEQRTYEAVLPEALALYENEGIL